MTPHPIAPSYSEGLSDLQSSYRSTCRMLQKAQETTVVRGDRELINGMISDVQFAIDWMQTGKCPGNRRGIERRAAYQREKLMDPSQMQTYIEQQHHVAPSSVITEQQRHRLEHALSHLSSRERECYELHYGMCYSFQEIASLLVLKKGTVQYYLQTAQKKIHSVK
ncbi:sigma-70 family RNA polymerase sigma factor [Paenibacillus radicis (ex Xue et al. 2023)]|uniref:Sigma-70 family RNA polymerase sigma factor n=1 Tax=Paenibacillus radicis (ex Xue et al. 2023) TaxID=2972489 RepID=A0ABT1YUG6_9BACL|nr:sigma-70 family RNA polymerase sigma factor [Paenibacillus radicis (ex Xue et al. 2023)]MCR8636179.1 sigma-70 family RNA polymerase sigma factor [Paenibacillus radicis (ex Xue et al. 2023)]